MTRTVCPKNPKHKMFLTTAHVMQEWKVDWAGNFIRVTNDCPQVTHKPDLENLWTCATCGEQAEHIEE